MKTNNKIHVLIAEDSLTQAEHLKYLLEREGMRVTHGADGKEALDILMEEKPDLVISDIMMPRIDGYELCRRIKANKALRDIPVILLTHLTDLADVMKALECGADNFITKPFEEDYLMACVKHICSGIALREHEEKSDKIEIEFLGQSYTLDSDRLQILNLLLSTFAAAIQKNSELLMMQKSITELNASLEERVQERTQKVEQQSRLLDLTHDGIVVCSSDKKVLYWNKGSEHLFGISKKDATENLIDKILSLVDEDIMSIVRIAIEKGSYSGEHICQSISHPSITVHIRCYPLDKSIYNEPVVMMVMTDVTEKKRLESEFLRAQRLESIGALASGMAHDLNNILSPILMASNMLESTTKDEDSKKLLTVINSSIHRAVDLIKHILVFGKGALGGKKLIKPKDAVEELQRIMSETFPKNITLSYLVDDNMPDFLADSTQVHQLLLNLCVNARDAMPNGGELKITSRYCTFEENSEQLCQHKHVTAKNFILFEIADTGEGIKTEDAEHIFEPFYTTKGETKGTGLGLPTVKNIAESHQGWVEFSTRIGSGTQFRIYFPAGTEKGKEEVAEEIDVKNLQGHGEGILIIDDEASVRNMTRVTLEANGYKIFVANDGAQAVATYIQEKANIHLVVLDMSMPIMDGPATLRALSYHDSSIKVIAVSGLRAAEQLTESTQNVKGFLVKPYNSQKLLQLIAQVLKSV